ncbi:hypothetical protein CEXT_383382 [Caerostris extrusa]|uniref:C3H1-type domain-containing protein n=1 Tax=Caerostris extrusa TaxID=172846 RepID=A0AAV4PBV6_CAEEX|nr:hypothetical protein CEXT_383382 [Caerostris extrusa]
MHRLHTELLPRRGAQPPDPQDKELMPPPLLTSASVAKENEDVAASPEKEELQKKRSKGALEGIASLYGSDSDEEEETPPPKESCNLDLSNPCGFRAKCLFQHE